MIGTMAVPGGRGTLERGDREKRIMHAYTIGERLRIGEERAGQSKC